MNTKFDLTLVNNCVEEFAAVVLPEFEKTSTLAKNLMALAESERKEEFFNMSQEIEEFMKEKKGLIRNGGIYTGQSRRDKK